MTMSECSDHDWTMHHWGGSVLTGRTRLKTHFVMGWLKYGVSIVYCMTEKIQCVWNINTLNYSGWKNNMFQYVITTTNCMKWIIYCAWDQQVLSEIPILNYQAKRKIMITTSKSVWMFKFPELLQKLEFLRFRSVFQ